MCHQTHSYPGKPLAGSGQWSSGSLTLAALNNLIYWGKEGSGSATGETLRRGSIKPTWVGLVVDEGECFEKDSKSRVKIPIVPYHIFHHGFAFAVAPEGLGFVVLLKPRSLASIDASGLPPDGKQLTQKNPTTPPRGGPMRRHVAQT